jgi:5-methylcytosine-specific restriction protein A
MPFRPQTHRPAWAKPRAEAERLRKARLDKQRPAPKARGYDDAWRKLRTEFLRQNPWCISPGCTEFAVEVDHRVPIAVDPSRRLNWCNLQSLCRHHHSQKTAREVNSRR